MSIKASASAAPVIKNVGSNWTLSVVQILVFLVLTPFVVNTLGKSAFGVWETIVALCGPLQLLMLGVPMASVRYVAKHVASGDTRKASAALSTCVGITAAMSLAALLLSVVLWFVFERAYLGGSHWSGLTPATLSDARVAFALMAVTVSAGFVLRLPYGVFDAHHDFVARNLIMGAGFVAKLGLTVGLLSLHVSLSLLALVQFACMAGEFAAALAISRRRHTGIRFGLGHFDGGLVRDILSFSVFAMLLNVGALLAFRLDAVVIGLFASEDQVAVYGIGNKVFEPFVNLVLAIGMVVMPMAAALKGRSSTAELARVFLRWSKIASALVLLLGLYLLVLGPEFLEWWIADEYVPESGRLLQVLMVSFLFFLPVRGVALPILMGLGRPGRPALALALMGVLNLALSVALIRSLGLLGVALGTAIPNVAFAVYVLRFACNELGVGSGRVLAWVAGRALPGALPSLALLLLLKLGPGVHGLLPLVLAGLGHVALFALTWGLFVLRGDPDLDLPFAFAGRSRRAPLPADDEVAEHPEHDDVDEVDEVGG